MQLKFGFTQSNTHTSVCSKFDDSSSWLRIESLVKDIPPPDEELLPGIKWGDYRQMYTPAFWKIQYHLADFPETNTHCLGKDIIQEVVACLLGGYGLPSEVGLLAFQRLTELNLIKLGVNRNDLFDALSAPFRLENGKLIKYRFFNQKTNFIYRFLNRKDLKSIPLDNDQELRAWLMTIQGVGPKTASWITRNWLQSDSVAIIDIHIHRAGIIAGFFDHGSDVASQYFELENSYISFCNALEVKPSNLDALIWENMKSTNRIALQLLR